MNREFSVGDTVFIDRLGGMKGVITDIWTKVLFVDTGDGVPWRLEPRHVRHWMPTIAGKKPLMVAMLLGDDQDSWPNYRGKEIREVHLFTASSHIVKGTRTKTLCERRVVAGLDGRTGPVNPLITMALPDMPGMCPVCHGVLSRRLDKFIVPDIADPDVHEQDEYGMIE